VERAFAHAGLDPAGHVVIDRALFRPAEVESLVADPTKARTELGWTPSTTFDALVAMMVDADLERLAAGTGRPVHARSSGAVEDPALRES
jgi:GDPmannose 4,6-dehydratase